MVASGFLALATFLPLFFGRSSPLVFVFLSLRLSLPYSVLSPPPCPFLPHGCAPHICLGALSNLELRCDAKVTAIPIWEQIIPPLEIHQRLDFAIFLFLSHLSFFLNIVGSCVRLPPRPLLLRRCLRRKLIVSDEWKALPPPPPPLSLRHYSCQVY